MILHWSKKNHSINFNSHLVSSTIIINSNLRSNTHFILCFKSWHISGNILLGHTAVHLFSGSNLDIFQATFCWVIRQCIYSSLSSLENGQSPYFWETVFSDFFLRHALSCTSSFGNVFWSFASLFHWKKTMTQVILTSHFLLLDILTKDNSFLSYTSLTPTNT